MSSTLDFVQSPQQDLDTDGFQEWFPGLNGSSRVPYACIAQDQASGQKEAAMRNAAVLLGSDVSKTHLDRAVRQSVRLQSNHYIPNNAKSLLQALQGLMDHAGLITEQHAFPVYSSLGTYPILQQTRQGIYYILMKL